MVSKKLLYELQKIIREEQGICLNLHEISKTAKDLVGLFDLLAKIEYRRKK